MALLLFALSSILAAASVNAAAVPDVSVNKTSVPAGEPIVNAALDGGFVSSCDYITKAIIGSSVEIYATCKTDSGGTTSASINVNTCLGNSDGILVSPG